jgi:hypothetical protein
MRNLKTLTLGLALAIAPGAAYATQTMNKAESNVQFTKAPEVTNVSNDSVKINWSTDSASSAKVQYRSTNGGDWKTASATPSNGQKDFTATLNGLEAGKTYEYQLVTNTGYVRHRGQFTAGGNSSASDTSSTSSASSTSGSDSQQRAEAAVQITQGPKISVDSSGTNATMTWTTNNVAANQVQYRPTTGGNWKNAYDRQGSRDHSLQLTGLQPGQTYEYKILTRDGDTRTSGQFTATAGATASGSANNTSAAANTGASSASASTGTKAPLYRAVNASGAHIYTQQPSQLPSGFNQESVSGYVMTSQVDGTAALYALSNSSNGDFFYTTDANERASAMNSRGYQDRGIAGYVATSQQSGTVPLYRMLNSNNGQHFYTINASERANLLGQGFKDEGIAGYVWQSQ